MLPALQFLSRLCYFLCAEDGSDPGTASPASSDAGESESSTSVPGAIRRDAAAWRRGEAIAAAVGLHRAGERERGWRVLLSSSQVLSFQIRGISSPEPNGKVVEPKDLKNRNR